MFSASTRLGMRQNVGDELPVRGGLVARGDDAVASVFLGPLRMAGAHHGREDLAAVAVSLPDDPVTLAQGEVDDRHLLLEEDPCVFRCTREEQGCVGAERPVREFAYPADRGPCRVPVEGTRGEYAQASCIGDRRHHLGYADPAHAGKGKWE